VLGLLPYWSVKTVKFKILGSIIISDKGLAVSNRTTDQSKPETTQVCSPAVTGGSKQKHLFA